MSFLNTIANAIYLIKKKLFKSSRQVFDGNEISVNRINGRIKSILGTNKNYIEITRYENYFSLLRSLGLWREFQILTTEGELMLSGSHIKPIIINDNNDKLIIFCHGITNNRWSLFYCVHLVLQLGYQAIIYDARNHGLSEGDRSDLGRLESSDLEDIVNWAEKHCQVDKIGFYGFSLGASTLLFWLGSHQDQHQKVKFLICESPFDKFSELLNYVSSSNNPNSWRALISLKFVRYFVNLGENLAEANPILALPANLSVKLLLLHGLSDRTISWKSSYNIWRQCQKNPSNSQYVNTYFFVGADHGEVPFIADASPGRLRWIKRRRESSRFKTFTELLMAFLEKNF